MGSLEDDFLVLFVLWAGVMVFLLVWLVVEWRGK